jgi:hypothetical protein
MHDLENLSEIGRKKTCSPTSWLIGCARFNSLILRRGRLSYDSGWSSRFHFGACLILERQTEVKLPGSQVLEPCKKISGLFVT